MTLLTTLLRLYPREWRARYEDEFTALLEQNRSSFVDVLDIALGALDAHLRPQVTAEQVKSERRPFVNGASFRKWSGIAGMIGSVLVLLGIVGASLFSDSEYPYTYDGFDFAARLVFLMGAVLTLVFVVGLTMANGRKIGVLGQVGLLLAFLGLLSMGLGGTGQLADVVRGSETGWWWDFFVLGLAGTLVGAGIFSLAGMAQKVLPSAASKLTMIGGFGVVVALLLSIGLVPDSVTDAFAREAVRIGAILATVALLVTFTIGLVLLSYDLWTGHTATPRQSEPAAVG